MLSIVVSATGGIKLSTGQRQSLLRATKIAVRHLQLTFPINIVITDSLTSRRLNSRYRGINTATDVLSFFYEEPPRSGEIIICYDVARRQAKDMKHSIVTELAQLVIHGCVHIAGYDHEVVKDKQIMRKIEAEIWYKYEQSN